MPKTITIRPLCCGYMRVSPSVLYGNDVNLRHSAHQLFERDEKRVVLPVYAFLIEHPQGRFLIDTGFPRELSPKGEYDPKAVSAMLPKHPKCSGNRHRSMSVWPRKTSSEKPPI